MITILKIKCKLRFRFRNCILAMIFILEENQPEKFLMLSFLAVTLWAIWLFLMLFLDKKKMLNQ